VHDRTEVFGGPPVGGAARLGAVLHDDERAAALALGDRMIGALARDPYVDMGAQQFGAGPDDLRRSQAFRDQAADVADSHAEADARSTDEVLRCCR